VNGKTNVIVRAQPKPDFMMTPPMQEICTRGMACLEAGYPLHLSGPAGTGKTTLALHLAGLLNQPIMLLYGDEEFGSSDLIGGSKGYATKRLVDNFIHSVVKTEESSKTMWMDERLTIACRSGYTLVYDEFSRSHAEANNVLLSILEEGIIAMPKGSPHGSFLNVHPNFRAIFTSNPDEYAGVYTPPSALLDRMVTIKMGNYDRETEVAITQAKSGLPHEDANKIVNIVRIAREKNCAITLRACIMIAKIINHRKGKVLVDDPILEGTCRDVLNINPGTNGELKELIRTAINMGGN